MREIQLEEKSRYADIPGISEKHRVSTTVLRAYCKHTGHVERLMVSYIPADGLGRRESYGPILPGPFAATFALATVIDNFGGTGREMRDNEAAGLEFDVELGDHLMMDGVEWEIRDDVYLHYPRLYPV